MITATKKWNPSGTKATVTVTFENGDTQALGGARAARARAAIVANWNEGRPPGVIGLRADVEAAENEARRLMTATTMRHQGATVKRVPYAFAAAIIISESEAK